MSTLTVETARGAVRIAVRRADVRNFNLRVRADGSVALSMPRRARLADAQAMVERHAAWIERALARHAERAQGPRGVPGILDRSSIALWGGSVAMRALVEPGRKRSRALFDERHGVTLLIAGGSAVTRDEREAVARNLVDRIYRDEVARRLPNLARRYEQELGVTASSWSIRRMRTRWGSCTPSSKRIRINLALAAYPPICLEYVVAHELAHLVEPSHNARFHRILDAAFPDGGHARKLLRAQAPADPLLRRSTSTET